MLVLPAPGGELLNWSPSGPRPPAPPETPPTSRIAYAATRAANRGQARSIIRE